MPPSCRPYLPWLFLAAAACSAGGVDAVAGPARAADRAMVVAAREGGQAAVTPLVAALVIGFPGDADEVARRANALDATLTAIAREVSASSRDPATRGRALLEALFAPHDGRRLLRAYDADATTLGDIVTTGRFNCVSATMLYLLGAARVGVDARPVLLPSHARAVVVVGGHRFVVETTTRRGFDAPAWVSKQALDRARPQRSDARFDLYSDERGTEVDWNALLGIAYGNLGTMAQEHGDPALAASLLAREAALTPPAEVPLVRAQQVSLLTELATRALDEKRYEAALGLATHAFDVAADPGMKDLTSQNVAAIAAADLKASEPALDDAAIVAFAERIRAYPKAYGDVRALALTLVASRRLKRGDVEGSSRALSEAAHVATSSRGREQATKNLRIGELNRIGAMSKDDPEGAWAALATLGPPASEDAASEADTRRVVARNRAVKMSNDGRCAELDAFVGRGEAPGDDVDRLRAACRERLALAQARGGNSQLALDNMRAAVRLEPGEPRHKKNLLALLEQAIDQLVRASRCSAATPLVAEGRALAPSESFWDDAAALCARAR
jgi:hypothetical protein